VGAELIKAASPTAVVHMSDPTWGNHSPLMGGCGLSLARYPYYDAVSHELLFDAMLQRLHDAAEGDVVLIHACCHNPTGADLSDAQWQTVTDLLERRKLIPFLDLAYQGFGSSLEGDAAPIRRVIERVPEALVAVSFSKNLGLYRERVGGLIVISESASRADAVYTHMLHIARSIYSMPPDHGAAIAARIFAAPQLRQQWVLELDAMRTRILEMRALLADRLQKATGGNSFDFIRTQHGMFSLLGVSREAVERLREKHHIYMTPDSRMNLAGIMPGNVDYVAEAFAAEAQV
jgi:aspartate aminotransferase